MEKKIAIEFTSKQLNLLQTIFEDAQAKNIAEVNSKKVWDITELYRAILDQRKPIAEEQVEIKPLIEKGNIVSYKGGNYRVTSARGGKVNLGSIFGKTIYHKGVLVSEVFENEKEWYKKWSQSETYMCM